MYSLKRFHNVLCLCVLLILCGWSSLPTDAASSLSPPFYVHLIQWSPDGRKIALTTSDGVRIVDANFQPLQFFPYSDLYILPYARWSPDGTRLTAGQMILDAATLKPLVTLASPDIFPQWSPDGQLILDIAADYRGIELYDSQTGQLLKTLTTDGIQMSSPALLSPDGSRFLTQGHTNTIVIIDAAKGGVIARFEKAYSMSSLIWSPDSQRIAYWAVEEVPPGTPGSYQGPGANAKTLLYFIAIINASNGDLLQRSAPLPGGVKGFSWSPDGSELTGFAPRGSIRTWNTLTGELIDSFLASGDVTAAAYTPYGGRYILALNFTQYPMGEPPEPFIPLSNFSQSFLDGKLQVIVPAPSLEKLQSINKACGLQISVQSTDDLPTFSDQVSRLTDADIPPACKADLLAVAEALMK